MCIAHRALQALWLFGHAPDLKQKRGAATAAGGLLVGAGASGIVFVEVPPTTAPSATAVQFDRRDQQGGHLG